MRKTVAPHIEIDERGIAYLDGTETKVLSVVLNKRLSRDTPEQLRSNMPHLTISQVYAALAYYHDHRDEIERQIEAFDRVTHELRSRSAPSFTRDELLARRIGSRGKTVHAG